MIDRARTEPRFLNTDNDLLDKDSSEDEGEDAGDPEDNDDAEVEAASSFPPTPVAKAAVDLAVAPAARCWIKRPACDETVQFVRNYKHCYSAAS